ncbi:hypothetical protein EV361DRAFT_992488 [Lentinula raphanica]|nr:hypothetical protein EV361DRAFT_992488 [Lentinula raphanica]
MLSQSHLKFLDGYPETSDASNPPSNHYSAGSSKDVAGMMADTASILTINVQSNALERLEALSKILQGLARAEQKLEARAEQKPGDKPIEYRYYFPSSNYVDKCDPGAQAWINKKQADALNIIYIPFVKEATEKMIKHHFRKVKRGVDMSTVTVIVELGDGLYALLIPNPGPVKFRVGLDFENKDLRAAKWQNLKGVRAQQKKQLMPDRYY